MLYDIVYALGFLSIPWALGFPICGYIIFVAGKTFFKTKD